MRTGRRKIWLTGDEYGRLKVIGPADDYVSPHGRHQPQWLCTCECGKLLVVRGDSLRSGNTQSCGCLRDELAAERMLQVWHSA